MSPKDKQDLQRQFESKMQEYQNLVQTVQRRVQEVNNELVQSMQPKLEAIVGEIQRAEKFNVILERKAAIYADPALDITKKVTERLNAGATSGGTGKPAK
jgi:outer membrane protein